MNTRLKKLKILVAMQFQDKLDISSRDDKKAIAFKVLYAILGFIFTTGLLYAFFVIGAMLNVLSLTKIIPDYVIIFLFTIMQIISILSCTVGLMKSFYFSADNPLLLTFPVKPNEVFISKLIVYYLLELKRSFTFLLPIFIAFGLNNYGFSGASLIYLLIVLLSFPFISLIPVVVGAILSIPAMYINMLLRQLKIVSFTIYIAIASAFVVLVFFVVSKIPSDFNIVRDFKNYYSGVRHFLISFSSIMAPFAAVCRMITGKTVIFDHTLFPISSLFTFLLLLGFLVAGVTLVYLINRPLFFKMSSKPFEYKKSVFDIARKNHKSNKFTSSVKKELLMMYRTPKLLFQNFSMIFTLPLAIFLMNKIFASMNTDLLGMFLSVCFNILVILLILTTSNTLVASLFSREGKAIYLLKTKPANLLGVTLSKMLLNIVLSTISILITSVIMLKVAMVPKSDSILIFFFATFINLGHILWSAELDIVNPQYEHYSDGECNIVNPNESKSVKYAFVLSFMFFAISLFLYIENPRVVWIKLVLMAILFLFVRVWLFAIRAKIYFKQM